MTEPVLRIAKGDPTPEELAALLAVVSARAAAAPAPSTAPTAPATGPPTGATTPARSTQAPTPGEPALTRNYWRRNLIKG